MACRPPASRICGKTRCTSKRRWAADTSRNRERVGYRQNCLKHAVAPCTWLHQRSPSHPHVSHNAVRAKAALEQVRTWLRNTLCSCGYALRAATLDLSVRMYGNNDIDGANLRVAPISNEVSCPCSLILISTTSYTKCDAVAIR